jgi:hypothetical protein
VKAGSWLLRPGSASVVFAPGDLETLWDRLSRPGGRTDRPPSLN